MKHWSKRTDIYTELSSLKGIGLTIGNFDGVHLGHQGLLCDLAQICEARGWESLVLTFDPHPRKILHPENPFSDRLFSLEDLKEQVVRYSIHHLWVEEFNLTLSQMNAFDFLKNYLEPLPISYIIVGHDFSFGREREGKVSDLQYWCKKKDIQFKRFPPFEWKGNTSLHISY